MAWDPLPDRLWQATVRSLNRRSEVVGRVRLALAEPLPPLVAGCALYVTPRGLMTSPIP
jgi:hypothetical protein